MSAGLYSIRDAKTESFSNPTVWANKATALRSFGDLASDKQNQIGRYPEDFALFELGVWDAATGCIDMHPQPINLGLAVEHVVRLAA